jgi:hypothetical protein
LCLLLANAGPFGTSIINHDQPTKIRCCLILISSRRYKLITSAIIKQQLIAVNYLDAFALATPEGYSGFDFYCTHDCYAI